jgi:hypothetical protein
MKNESKYFFFLSGESLSQIIFFLKQGRVDIKFSDFWKALNQVEKYLYIYQ